MPMRFRLPACSRCGDPIGVYERFWLELADGMLRSSSYLNLHLDLLGHRNWRRLWHLDCVALEDVLRSTEC
jgi:hypothetical protein